MPLIVEPSKENTILPKILRAALKLFVKKGIDGTTREIADKAGVSEGALYRHFKSKNDLAWHLFSTHLDGFSSNLIVRIDQEKTIRKKVSRYVSVCMD